MSSVWYRDNPSPSRMSEAFQQCYVNSILMEFLLAVHFSIHHLTKGVTFLLDSGSKAWSVMSLIDLGNEYGDVEFDVWLVDWRTVHRYSYGLWVFIYRPAVQTELLKYGVLPFVPKFHEYRIEYWINISSSLDMHVLRGFHCMCLPYHTIQPNIKECQYFSCFVLRAEIAV